MAPDVCVIVPTVRDFATMRTYFANARAHGFDLARLHVVFVTEDSCDKQAMRDLLRAEGVAGEVFGGAERQAWFAARGLERFADLIPRRSHAETSFGLLVMLAEPAFRFGVFIDDDTAALPGHDFFGGHLAHLAGGEAMPSLRSDKGWVNVLHQGFARHRLYPRGYPYSAMGETTTSTPIVTRRVVCSQGLWTNVPDLDAVRILMEGDLDGQSRMRTGEADFTGDFVAAPGQQLTVCSMNLAFRREVIPAFYQLPMDDNPWRIGRFDDIWSGVLLKRAADLLGAQVVTGGPLCAHNKAPRSTFKDLNAEVPALEINEHLWSWLADPSVRGATWAEAMRSMADRLAAVRPQVAYAEFLPYMAERMRRWVDCCEAIAGTTG